MTPEPGDGRVLAADPQRPLQIVRTGLNHEHEGVAADPADKTLGWFIPIMRELAEMQYQWLHEYDFRCDRFQAAFGGEPLPHAEGVKQTLEWFAAHPQR